MKQYLGDEADSQDLKVFYKLGTLAFLLVSDLVHGCGIANLDDRIKNPDQ